MGIKKLDHVNIRTPHLEATIAFYSDVLGMRAGLPLGMEGEITDAAWIYDDSGAAALHLGRAGMLYPGDTEVAPPAEPGSAMVHHVAFDCDDHAGVLGKLEAAGVEHFRNDMIAFGLRQIFARDPNGVLVELNFR
ncbi:glyoxalase [Sphingomonas sp. DBB INV C78]|uniref:VOC family protein n=1 Tax=Sphingomonas sp. DBB INV C78 TaxID=3349434 RepID=UPI0036D3BCAE